MPDPPPGGEPGSGATSEALIFVSDASAEAERLTASLRTRGYLVVDVPLGLLIGRVAVQRPALILCDADAPGAIESIERLRELPGIRRVDVLFLGEPSRTVDEQAERLAREGSGVFVRPVDVYALLRKVESLLGPPIPPSARPSALPQGSRAPVLVAATRRPYRYDTRARSRNLPIPSGPPASPRAETTNPAPPITDESSPAAAPFPGTFASDLVGSDALSGMGVLSPDLAALLGRAEERVIGSRLFSSTAERLSPEAELEAVLPHDLLSALDEPLDELDDDDDDEIGTPGTPGTQGSDSSLAGGRGTSRSGESAAGTAPGGSVNPFAPRDPTTSGGEGRDEPEPPSAGPAPATPPAIPARTQPPSVGTRHGVDATGLGSMPPSRTGSEPFPEPVPAAPPPIDPDDAPGEALAPLTPKQQASTRPPRARQDVEPPSLNEPLPPPPSIDVEIPTTLRAGDAVRVLARAVRARYSGAIAFEDDAGIRRVVLRDGDFVMAATGIDSEALTAFLAQRGDLGAEVAARLGRKLPQFGRHAGAALIAQGHLRQEDLWPVLRAHAEWLITRIATLARGGASLERVIPPRLSSEPSVFGGATGAEVLIEVVRRAIAPSDALLWLGGPEASLGPGQSEALLAECAQNDTELEWVRSAAGTGVGELLERAGSQEFATVLFALVELGVLLSRTHSRKPRRHRAAPADVIDHDAVRARIRARRALVDEGDYFALLGVSRGATSYDIRRAYTTLRQEFDPGRILTPLTADLGEDVDVILDVLDEAYEILRDQVRRERYRRALED